MDQALHDAEIIDPCTVLPITACLASRNAKLSDKMQSRLKDLGISELFAVQTCLLPFLMFDSPSCRSLYLPYNPPRDVCVSAPTGSGKTLAYVIPIVEILSSRIVTRLRALIVLPTRDLVAQVRETFESVAKGRGLKISAVTGQHSFAHEQPQLVHENSSQLRGGSSKIDILICTPGRLIDHLNGTPGFTLQHLRFLVIDEADRLLSQSYQDWLVQVLAATRKFETSIDAQELGLPDLLPLSDTVAPSLLQNIPVPHVSTFLTEKQETSCQKLLFSATLTRDPGKIAALELRDPKYFLVQSSSASPQDTDMRDAVAEKFSVPSTLTEFMLVCETAQKPLIFFHLIETHQIKNALVFTKSAESTTRLVLLLDFFQNARIAKAMEGTYHPLIVRAYSSDLSPSERKSILDKFKAQDIHILICSDLITRGIDISHVSHVISYDIPVDMRKYVHRVGRTARAGRSGDAWSLVEEQEARHFKAMLKEADRLDRVKKVRVSDKDVAHLTGYYETALANLKDHYTRRE